MPESSEIYTGSIVRSDNHGPPRRGDSWTAEDEGMRQKRIRRLMQIPSGETMIGITGCLAVGVECYGVDFIDYMEDLGETLLQIDRKELESPPQDQVSDLTKAGITSFDNYIRERYSICLRQEDIPPEEYPAPILRSAVWESPETGIAIAALHMSEKQ